MAAQIHAFYTGCEAVLVKVVRITEDLPDGERLHQTLLIRAAASIPDVRPPVLSVPTAETLHELLRFRHFFRNAYGVELDAARLRELADLVPQAYRGLQADVERFLAEAASRTG